MFGRKKKRECPKCHEKSLIEKTYEKNCWICTNPDCDYHEKPLPADKGKGES